MLEKYEKIGLIYQGREFVEVDEIQRMKLAVHALRLGADIEAVCRLLDWSEFEQVAIFAFNVNGYKVKKNLRFKWAGRKWEIDVLGLKSPLIVCVDCKQWIRGWQRAAAIKAVEAQIERTKAFTESLDFHVKQLPQLLTWKKILVAPVVISLFSAPLKFYKNVPIVPVLKLQNFLNELLAHVHEIRIFQANLRNKRFSL